MRTFCVVFVSVKVTPDSPLATPVLSGLSHTCVWFPVVVVGNENPSLFGGFVSAFSMLLKLLKLPINGSALTRSIRFLFDEDAVLKFLSTTLKNSIFWLFTSDIDPLALLLAT